MSSRPRVEVDAAEYQYHCACGWSGGERAIEDWAVQRDRDRVVRRCPGCGAAVPEWGAHRPIDGVAKVAKGELRETLVEAGVVD